MKKFELYPHQTEILARIKGMVNTSTPVKATTLECSRKGRPMHHQLVTGPGAESHFREHLSWLFDDDVTGTLHSSAFTSSQLTLKPYTMCSVERNFEMLANTAIGSIKFFLLQCSNKRGDAWKSTFYPNAQATVFVMENH